MFLLGFDIGGTKIEAALVAIAPKVGLGASSVAENSATVDAPNSFELAPFRQGQPASICQVIARQRVPTERSQGYEAIAQKIIALVKSVCAEARITPQDLAGVGLGIPGSVDPYTQYMLNGNTMVLVGRDLAGDVARGAGLQSTPFCENDANCFALAEALCGAGARHAHNIQKPLASMVGVGIILGTGCGGGVVIGTEILRGRRGGAAEVGHSVFRAGGHPCYCGRAGCAEQYLSGPALEGAFNSRRYSQIEGNPGAREIFALAAAKDPVAVAVVRQYGRHLGEFLGNLTTLFDPDYFVLGGGISRQDAIYEGLSECLATHSFLPNSQVPVYQHQLGDSAGVIGAALLPVSRKSLLQ